MKEDKMTKDLKQKIRWQVLAMPNDLSNREKVGEYPTKYQALEVIKGNIKKYSKYGMALLKKCYSGGYTFLEDAWNYTVDSAGEIYYCRNHHDLW